MSRAFNIFDEVAYKDERSEVGMITGIQPSCLSIPVYTVLWYSGAYATAVYEDKIVGTGKNIRDEYKRRKKH